jgi:hypothetical protein
MTANPLLLKRLQAAIIRVGAARGFIIETVDERLVLTAAHCLPRIPAPHSNLNWGQLYQNLLGPLDQAEQTVWAECRFVDPVADVAVLGTPEVDITKQTNAYNALVNTATPLRIAQGDVSGPVFALGLDPTVLITGTVVT